MQCVNDANSPIGVSLDGLLFASKQYTDQLSEGILFVLLTRPPWKAWSFVLYGNASGRSTSLAAANMCFSHLVAGCQEMATSGEL